MYISSAALTQAFFPAMSSGLSAVEAGEFIRAKRKELGLTQEQLVERTGLSSQSYLSSFEKGRYHIGRSEHFPAVARELRLTQEEITRINPGAVVTVASRDDISPAPQPMLRPIPAGLQEMIDEKQGLVPELATERWQQYLAGQRFSTGSASAERWWNLYLTLKNAGIEPGGN